MGWLLDADRFYGKFRDGAHKVDVADLMRRMVKEDMLKFDGTPLFPERRAYTVNYQLSDPEAALYAAVTDYVKTEFARADQLADGGRKGTVGFALTALQRRLASSPEAIYQSLKRRRNKLKRRVEDEKLRQRGQLVKEGLAETVGYENGNGSPEDIWESADDFRPKPMRTSRNIWSIRPRRRRPSRNSKPKSSSSKGWKNRPGRSCTPAKTASGTNSPACCKTRRRCTTAPVASASSSSSPNTATR